MLFEGTADADLVNLWTEHFLCKVLRPNSTLIYDNAAFHKKDQLEAIAKKYGHHILFLPPYSPDFNPIENDFAIIKKQRQYASPNTSLQNIIQAYGN